MNGRCQFGHPSICGSIAHFIHRFVDSLDSHRALEEAIVDVCIVNYPKDAIPFEDNYELLLKVRTYSMYQRNPNSINRPTNPNT